MDEACCVGLVLRQSGLGTAAALALAAQELSALDVATVPCDVLGPTPCALTCLTSLTRLTCGPQHGALLDALHHPSKGTSSGGGCDRCAPLPLRHLRLRGAGDGAGCWTHLAAALPRLAPWLRTLELDPSCHAAFVEPGSAAAACWPAVGGLTSLSSLLLRAPAPARYTVRGRHVLPVNAWRAAVSPLKQLSELELGGTEAPPPTDAPPPPSLARLRLFGFDVRVRVHTHSAWVLCSAAGH